MRSITTYLSDALDHHYGMSYAKKRIRSFKPEIIKKEHLHILLATFFNYPHVGGLSNYITILKNKLQSLGHHVDVVARSQFDEKKINKLHRTYSEQLKEFSIERYGSYNSKIVKNSVNLYVYEQLLNEIDLTKYDVFHAQDLFTANVLGRCSTNQSVFFTPHGTFTNSRLKFGKIEKNSIEENYFRYIEEQGIAYADKIIMISDSFRKPLLEFGAKKEQLYTVHTGIEWVDIPKQPTGQIIITIVSRLSPRKGHTYLLKALAILDLKNVKVWIVGDGEMRKELEKETKYLKLSNVTFFGSRSDIADILSKSDIYVLPTINDNFPLSIIEAMFSEQAILTTNCGGIPEIIINNKTGLLVEPTDVDELAYKLSCLIKYKFIRQRLAKNAKKYAKEHLTADEMVNQIINLYKSQKGEL